MPPRILIVGCGNVTEQFHGPCLRILEDAGLAVVSAVADPNPARVAVLKQVFPAAREFSSLKAVDTQTADIALITSPPGFHCRQTIECLQRGMAVFCEKPMASSIAEAEAMAGAASELHKLLAVGFIRRFFPATRYIRELIASKSLGSVVAFQGSEGGRFSWNASSASFFSRSISGGGALIDTGSHILDLILWWFGEPLTVDYADDFMGGPEANCRVSLGYDGFRALIQLSRDYNLPNEYTIVFERGTLRWKPYAAERFELDLGVGCGPVQCSLSREAVSRDDGKQMTYEQCFVLQWKNFLNAFLGNERLVVPGAEALQSARLVQRCYDNRSLLEMPWLTPPEQATARRLSEEKNETNAAAGVSLVSGSNR